MKPSDKLLKNFLEEQIPFDDLKKVGFFPKGTKKTDIHVIAERVCTFFGYKSIYEYGTKEIRAHVTYASGTAGLDSDRPLHVNEQGELKEEPFVTVFKSWLNE